MEGSDQPHPQEKEMEEGKVVVRGALQTAEDRREVKSKGERERYSQLNAEFQKIAKREKKDFFNY